MTHHVPRLGGYRGLLRMARLGKSRIAGLAGRFLSDRSAVVAVYAGVVGALLIGASAVVFDIGRVGLVKSQMQNAADSAAIAGAVQLDRRDGARARAQAVAESAASQKSLVHTEAVAGGSSTDIVVDDVSFYSQYTPSKIDATSDNDALFVEVTIAPRDVSLFMEPVLALVAGSTSQISTQVATSAVARPSPIICNPPPLMVCNTDELGLDDLTTTSAIGKEILLRDGGNTPAPGNFGLMCPPSDPHCGAGVVEQFLAAETLDECTATSMTTKPGVNFNKVNNGVNSRFDMGTLPNPARDIIPYSRDSSFQSNVLGNGVWGPDTYWPANHGGNPLPGGLTTASTRYQVYLFELGEEFARNGKQTIYPVDDCTMLPPGFTCVTPAGPDMPVGGVPVSTPVADARRRIMKAAVVQCLALGVSGRTEIDMSDMHIIELFIAEPITGTGSSAPIVGEIQRLLTASNSNEILANAQLVE